MKLTNFFAVASLFAILAPTSAQAHPKGTVQLAKDSYFKKGNVDCGQINDKWIPGTLLAKSGFFISHTQYASNYRADASRASGKTKKNLLSQATSYTQKAKQQSSFCKNGPLYKFNFSGAKTLAILPDSTTNKLYKISSSGKLDVVTRSLIGGATVPISDTPVAVYPVGENFIMALFGLDDLNIFSGYLVRRSDGRIFSVQSVGFPSTYPTNTGFKNAQVVQLDQAGNAYYKVAETGSQGYNEFKVVKLDFSDPLALEATTVSPIDESSYNFTVNPAGNIVYNSNLRADPNNRYYRIKKTTGGLENIPLDSTYWTGPDGNFYYQYSSGGGYQTKKVVIDGSGNVSTTNYGDNSVSIPTNSHSYRFSFSSVLLFADADDGSVTEANNAGNNPRVVGGLPLTNINAGGQSAGHYFLAGNNGASQPCLIKVTPTDDSFTHLYTPGTYDVYTMAVSEEGEVTISALRLSDGKKVLVKFSSDGTEKSIDSELNVQAGQLMALN